MSSGSIARALAASALLTASAPTLAAAHGGEAHALHESPWTAWSPALAATLPIVAAGVLYAARARRLGPRLPRWRAWCFAAGLAVVALAYASPVDPLGERLFGVHMIQHTLLGAVAPLLLLLGVTGPVLRPLLARRWARRLTPLVHPAVALPAWTAGLVIWHLPPVHEAALAHDPIHALQHASVLALGLLMWAPVVEPVPGPAWFTSVWKGLYMTGVWAVGLITANIFWFSGTVFYPTYEATAPLFGVSAGQDQGNAGTVMMLGHCMLAFAAAGVLFFRQAAEDQLRQRLIEAGLDPVRVRRAVRAGNGPELARRHGIPVRLRAGID